MGAGHDTVAAELVRRAGEHGHRASTVDVLSLLPRSLGRWLRRGYQVSVRHAPWTYGAVYHAFLRPGRGPRPSGVPLARLAGDRLRELVERDRVDVVVPVFHLAAQLTGHLRASGLLPVPSVVYVIEFGTHRHWLHPGNDHFLCLTEQAAQEARRATGRPADVTGPVVAPRFTVPAPGAVRWGQVFARKYPGRTPVLMSAGAWGVASRPHTTARLLAGHGYLPVVLCGRNERLRTSLARVPGTMALGWQEDMPGLMGAARALVDNAGGLTAVQALAAGLPVVSHRPLPGHFAQGARRMAGLGVSDLAEDEAELLADLTRLTRPGAERELRIARGRELFHGESEPLDRVLAVAAADTGK
ncbi:galactosyldiacylglycerol synthase [Streptomyces sp. RY43-2]|uniref:Galactosyldiacylglycerol synthase n=2 Tax=Streptomyces macrolidinus TaxID=2952607 RepID=A0ABT0ZFI6_9ACTN|nr:galactosyldiacylglycerol synthase [Streptomyces macrolidinus]MCN9242327.1 galactosyldiacylglycerol synthase [Streptomyces macrolidinus]